MVMRSSIPKDQRVGRCYVGRTKSKGRFWAYLCIDCGGGAAYETEEMAMKMAGQHNKICEWQKGSVS